MFCPPSFLTDGVVSATLRVARERAPTILVSGGVLASFHLTIVLFVSSCFRAIFGAKVIAGLIADMATLNPSLLPAGRFRGGAVSDERSPPKGLRPMRRVNEGCGISAEGA